MSVPTTHGQPTRLSHREDTPERRHAVIDPEECLACGKCASLCPWGAISGDGPANDFAPFTYRVAPGLCRGCGACRDQCPGEAITLVPARGPLQPPNLGNAF
jgi:ferredoxin